MSRIHVLDKNVAELIAAGEVVERPSSIVKELIENSIDAGATKVTVEIKAGGIGYIRVTDNGAGIHNEDIPHAFLRHATSKVYTEKDLESIGTLGFRGEALASVAAVAKVELTTKTKDSLDGWYYEIQGGTPLEIPKPVGAPDGTTLIIRDVFFNTPARMKFLRTDVAEGNAVAQVVDKCALSNPAVSITFIRDTKTRLQTSGNGDLLAAISAVYDREFAENMLPVDYTYEGNIKIKGFISKPSFSRPTRTYQNFFINNRYVRTNTCRVALEEGFKGKLMTGRFPACVLFVDLNPELVDANVHPAKIEVRFSQERPIYNAVYFGVKNTLSSLEKPITTSPKHKSEITPLTIDNFESFEKENPIQERFVPKKSLPIYESNNDLPKRLDLAAPTRQDSVVYQTREDYQDFITGAKPNEKTEKPVKQKEEVTADEPPEYTPLRFIGEAFNTYILLEREDDTLLLVDKHAAHERILYEEIKNNVAANNRQVLMSPETVTLQRDEYTVILKNLSKLEELGFLVEDFGMGTLIVRESPVVLDGEDVADLIAEIAAKLLENNRDLTPDALSSLYFSIACKSSVRGGDKNNAEELKEIIKRLELNPEITHCPHGRPVTIELSRQEIEKMFGRLG